MKHQLKRILERTLPAGLLQKARAFRIRQKNRMFYRQGTASVRVGGVDLDIPIHHPLPGLLQANPLRDRCVGITAQFVAEKYPAATMIDIGANVGDTAALIAESCSNPLILVEASDFFLQYLRKNAAKLKSRVALRNALVGDGTALKGELFHWGGTAEWKEISDSAPTPTVPLGSLTAEKVCFIKSDTDGHDFKILLSATEWLAQQLPTILLECYLRDEADLQMANALTTNLERIGYGGFILWDDAGNHFLSTTDGQVVKDVNRYFLRRLQTDGKLGISNFDMACFPARDQEVFEKSCAWWRGQSAGAAKTSLPPAQII